MPEFSLDLARDGAQLCAGAASTEIRALVHLFAGQPQDVAGVRLFGQSELTNLLSTGGALGSIAASAIGKAARPVRAILFDKTVSANWSLSWHQDRVICVNERIEVEGFGPWTKKGGKHHVAPPFAFLARMVTLRLHIDDVPAGNAPLLIAPGSHRLGLVRESDLASVVQQCGKHMCTADAGDVWIYSTPIVHASMASTQPCRRRVLQIDFSADELPGGLQWLGV